ncbi:hypothetical protein [Labilibaculum antarcticum]|uniref:Uncharacterized protein n=1 Tax=Labilibaculum antarcticum TaxID=1717717 RepID=A0A1Y1CIS7_9BACT|nr:hypothetical protein [Labilibaculum antarcticum]BAX80267.1 hypothetical protein ALGA_1908 [Labilibaculum antarcticum]
MKTLLTLTFAFLSLVVNAQNPYVTFLQKNTTRPIDYLESLFQEKDLVMICERDHREITQYDLFFDIISQDWFSDHVKNIIFESPSLSIQKELDDLLFAEDLSDAQIKSKTKHIYQNLNYGPLWEKTNLYTFIGKVARLNRERSSDKKIRIIGADVKFSWDSIKNKDEYKEFQKTLNNRDRNMAKNISDWYQSNANNKALIIMNYRHAYTNIYWKRKKKTDNVGRYLKEEFPNELTNVFLNSYANRRYSWNGKFHAKKKWDLAFQENDNKAVAFSMKKSPFGNDRFDDYPYITTNLKWYNVFDHLIFYNPLSEHINSSGMDNIINAEFRKELERRYRIIGNELTEGRINYLNKVRLYHEKRIPSLK